MKLNRYIYAAAKVGTAAFAVWLAAGAAQAFGWSAPAQAAIGSGVGVLLVLWIVAAELAVRDARAAVARIVREELHRDDVEALADSLTEALPAMRDRLTADVLAEQRGEWAVSVTEDGHRFGRPGRHTLMDDTQQLFTHDELFGDGTHDYNDVTEAFPGRLFPDGE